LSDEITAATGKHTSQKRQITNKVSLTVSTRVNEEKIRLLLKPTVKKIPVLSRLSSKVLEDITVRFAKMHSIRFSINYPIVHPNKNFILYFIVEVFNYL